MKTVICRLSFALCCVTLVACQDDSVTGASDTPDSVAHVDTLAPADIEAAEDVLPSVDVTTPSDVSVSQDVGPEDVTAEPEAPCTSTRRPIVAAHGFIASGDTWAPHARRLLANGYCREDIVAFDWNSVSAFTGNTDGSVPELALLIDEVLAARAATQVDLIGHSAGGGIAYSYLADAANAAKVAHYAHLGSFPQPGPAGPQGEVPTLNVWSEGDMAIEGKADIPGATNVRQTTADHYGVATNIETFEAIFTHFNDGETPAVLEPTAEETPHVWGRAVTFGENTPLQGNLSIYALDAATGHRLGEPLWNTEIPSGGYWGPFAATAGIPYEFTVIEDGNRPVHYYAEPFQSSNPLVYLRGFPGASSMVGFLLAGLPFDDVRSMLVVFSASRALTYGIDSLQVDGQEVLTADNASPQNSSIAFFLYDEDEDGETSMAPVAIFQQFPFLVGADMGLPATPEGSFAVTLNGRTIHVPAWPSDSEGATVVVFD